MRYFTSFFSRQIIEIWYIFLHLQVYLNSDVKFSLKILNLYLDFIKVTGELKE